MSERDDREDVLAECLEDYHKRRGLSEEPTALEYRDAAGEGFDEFKLVLEAEEAIDKALAPESEKRFPRPFGEYTLLRPLGSGSFGLVYEAIYRPLERKVALKVLRTGIDTDETARERFRREARACAQVRHDNIVEIYDIGEIDGQLCYSMALLEGATLRKLHKKRDVPPPKVLFRRVAEVADALQAMHDAGIVHRDIKPSNILVESTGRMVVCDFGVARTAAGRTLTETGQALGTLVYMSPEQLLGSKEIDGRSDVYALGATLYELLGRRPLITAEELPAIVRMIRDTRPTPLDDVDPNLPRACCDIVMKAVEKRKEDRYQSAAEFAADLRAFADGEEVVGRPVSALRHRIRAARRYLPAAAVVLALAVGGVYWQVTRPPAIPVHRLYEVIKNPEDREALSVLCAEYDVELPTFESDRQRGGPGEAAVTPVFPRGDVRLADLGRWRMDASMEFEPDGRVEFRRGNEVLYAGEFLAERFVTEEDIADAVTGALRVGDKVTWGYYPREGAAVTTTFDVVADSVGERLAAMEKSLAAQPRDARAHIAAQVLLESRFYIAAYREAEAVSKRNPQSARAWAVMQEALKSMGLRGSVAYGDVQKAISRLPDAVRAQAFRD